MKKVVWIVAVAMMGFASLANGQCCDNGIVTHHPVVYVDTTPVVWNSAPMVEFVSHPVVWSYEVMEAPMIVEFPVIYFDYVNTWVPETTWISNVVEESPSYMVDGCGNVYFVSAPVTTAVNEFAADEAADSNTAVGQVVESPATFTATTQDDIPANPSPVEGEIDEATIKDALQDDADTFDADDDDTSIDEVIDSDDFDSDEDIEDDDFEDDLEDE